ncbi:MAG: exo-alpha-sialidase [Planctomycetes bacterium]|nr:exo-alpha-sialidase [Planctomycetota bacterium]
MRSWIWGIVCGVAFSAGLPARLAADDIPIERVIGPEILSKYKHPASITELANGDLYIAYYGGSGEYSPDTAVYGMRQVKGKPGWTKPVVIADTPFRTDGNAVVWQAPDGIVWLFYLTRYGETWSDSRTKFKISRDGAQTWSDSEMLSFEKGMMVRSAPIVLKNGDYLLPIYNETGADREFVGADTTSLFFRRDAKTGEWTETNRVKSRIGNLQPAVVQITDEYLVAYSRRGGGYDGKEDGRLVRSESRDGGKTWSAGIDSPFRNPNAAADFIRLQNGHLLLVFNDSNDDRMPLTVAISTDNDKTYPYQKNIVNKPGDTAAYPFAIQTKDGKIHVIYTSETRAVINHAVFDERAILGDKK